jgi:hypothetical protein
MSAEQTSEGLPPVTAAATTPPRRRGKAVKKPAGNGKTKAVFEPGSAAGPAFFDAERIASGIKPKDDDDKPSGPSLYWEAGGGDAFLVENKQGTNGSSEQTWDEWPKDALKSLMRQEHCIALKARDGEFVSEFENLLIHVRRNRIVDLSTARIAGYPSGLHTVFGSRVLVRRSSRYVKPEAGDCSAIRKLIESRLNLDEGGQALGPQQAVYFYGWCKASLEARLQGKPGDWRPGQGLIFAGVSDCGKSRLQHNIITPLLGGRSANPGPYLFGATDFNAELASAEHLLMEDPASGTRNFDRVYFGEMWKQLIVADTFRLHRKREDAVTVCPFFRSSISVNNDPDKMRVLPLLTPDMREKVMLFLVNDEPIPFPLATMEERAAFVALMRAQMPAFAHWLLNEFELPGALFHKRYGVKQWLHPELAKELFEDTPAAELLSIIDAATWADGVYMLKLWERESYYKGEASFWEGTAEQLEQLLEGSSMREQAARWLKHNSLARALGRLAHDEPERVIRHRTNMRRGWMIAGSSE